MPFLDKKMLDTTMTIDPEFKLRKAGALTQSGRFAPGVSNSDRGDGGSAAVETTVGIPGVAKLRKPRPRPEAPREMTELEKVRAQMAKKMQERLRQMEEQDVADSWDDTETEV